MPHSWCTPKLEPGERLGEDTMTGLRRISCLWKEPDAIRDSFDRRLAAQPHQSIQRNPRFPGQPGESISPAPPHPQAVRAPVARAPQHPGQLRGRLLDSAPDAAPRLRSGERPDREARPDASGLHHRPRHHRRPHAAAHGRFGAAHSGFRGVERPLRRRSVVPPRHP